MSKPKRGVLSARISRYSGPRVYTVVDELNKLMGGGYEGLRFVACPYRGEFHINAEISPLSPPSGHTKLNILKLVAHRAVSGIMCVVNAKEGIVA